MSRKRRTDHSPSDETPEQSQEGVAAGVAELPAAEPPLDEPSAGAPSFAEKVGQRKSAPVPDPFGIASDKLAGVRLLESRQDRQMAIKFGEGRPEDKPSQAVIDKMKDAGFRWNPADRIWAIPVGGTSALSTRIAAEQLYQDVRQMIRQEKGIEPAAPEVAF